MASPGGSAEHTSLTLFFDDAGAERPIYSDGPSAPVFQHGGRQLLFTNRGKGKSLTQKQNQLGAKYVTGGQ